MSYFLGSLNNEWIKRKNRVLVVIVSMLIIFIGILITALLNDRFSFIQSTAKNIPNEESNSDQAMADELIRLTDVFQSIPAAEIQEKKRLQAQMEWYAFHIQNNIELNRTTTTHTIIKSMTGVYIAFLFPILMIFIGADIFTAELSSGTIKSMLLRPVRRQTIYHAKLAMLIGSSMIILLLSYVCNYLLNSRNGWGDWTSNIALQWGSIHLVPVWLFVLIALALNAMTIVVLSTVIVCISYYIRNLALSVICSMMIIILAKILLSPFQNSLSIQNYYFMRHVDLVSHLNATFKGQSSMMTSMMVLVCTGLICYGLVWFRIRKEDLPY